MNIYSKIKAPDKLKEIALKKGLYTVLLATALYDKDKKLADQSLLTKATLGTAALTTLGGAGILAEEAKASIRGARALKKINNGSYKNAAKALLPAYASYAVPYAILPYVGYQAVNTYKRLNKYKNNSVNEEEKD